MEYSGMADGMGAVENMRIKYFETLFPAVSLCLLKSGFLFVASEFGNHMLYQIENLGDDEEEQPEFQSIDFDQKSDKLSEENCNFQPRNLRNLSAVDEIESLCPLIDAKVLNLDNEETPQIYALCGRGSRSTFRILRHGLDVTEVAVSELPGNPSSVWTVRGIGHDYDKFIVISFINATLILRIGETVEEMTDTGFLVSTPTLAVGPLGQDDALVQVHPHGIRHIRPDRRVSEWRTPAGTTNMKSSLNNNQVATCLSTGEIVYFELDPQGNLNEFQQHLNVSSSAIRCIALAPISEGRVRSNFMAVGTSENTVQIISLDPSNCLEKVCLQALSSLPESLCFVEMQDPTTGQLTLFLNIGLTNGVLVRTTVDPSNGTLSDSRLLYLGTRPVKLIRIRVANEQAVLCLSSRSWIGYTFQNRYLVVPLCYEPLEYGSSFSSEQISEGLVAIKENTLRFFYK
jgi:splicing factor 3B subunit 3